MILENMVNTEFKKVFDWLSNNKLSLNLMKSTYMVFSNKREKAKITVKVGNQTLEQSSSVKYLGVTIDDKLNWNPHIKRLEKKVSSGCWALYKLTLCQYCYPKAGILCSSLSAASILHKLLGRCPPVKTKSLDSLT